MSFSGKESSYFGTKEPSDESKWNPYICTHYEGWYRLTHVYIIGVECPGGIMVAIHRIPGRCCGAVVAGGWCCCCRHSHWLNEKITRKKVQKKHLNAHKEYRLYTCNNYQAINKNSRHRPREHDHVENSKWLIVTTGYYKD